jgi:hypothetical protein
MAIAQTPWSQNSYVSKKLAPNFPLIFDPHEHFASFFHVAGHGNTLLTSDDLTVILVDDNGRLAGAWESSNNTPLPTSKTIMSSVHTWIREVLKGRQSLRDKRKTFRRAGSDHSSDSDSPSADGTSTPR